MCFFLIRGKANIFFFLMRDYVKENNGLFTDFNGKKYNFLVN